MRNARRPRTEARPNLLNRVPQKFFRLGEKLTEYGGRSIRLTIAMKTLLVTVSLALVGVSSTQAQVFRPSVGSGAVVGAVAGGLIGGHNGDRWAEGAVIGGVAGALIGAAMTPQEPVYQSAPVYQTSPQVIYTQPAPVVQSAPVVQTAPVASAAPTIVETVPTTQPQVVYVQQQPQVVYVESAPRVVYVERPAVTFGFGYYSGPRYHGGYRHGGGYYRGGHGHHHGHRHHGHHGHRGRH